MRKTNSYSCFLLPQPTEITVICHYFPPEYSREGKGYFIKFNMMMVKNNNTKHYCLLMSIPWGTKNHVYKTGRTGAILLVMSNPTSSLSLHTQIIIIQFSAKTTLFFRLFLTSFLPFPISPIIPTTCVTLVCFFPVTLLSLYSNCISNQMSTNLF